MGVPLTVAVSGSKEMPSDSFRVALNLIPFARRQCTAIRHVTASFGSARNVIFSGCPTFLASTVFFGAMIRGGTLPLTNRAVTDRFQSVLDEESVLSKSSPKVLTVSQWVISPGKMTLAWISKALT